MKTLWLKSVLIVIISNQSKFSGISMSGSCAGAFVLAPLSSYLSENHGWRATVGLYAGNNFPIAIEIAISKINSFNIISK